VACGDGRRREERDEDEGIATTRAQDTCHHTPVARPRQNIVDRLADLGEEAIQRIGNAPGGDRVLAAMAGTRDRLDDLQKRVRGLEDLDKRVASIERRLDKLEGKGKTASTTTRKSSSPSTTRKSSGSSSS
jgi:hypothetical protein